MENTRGCSRLTRGAAANSDSERGWRAQKRSGKHWHLDGEALHHQEPEPVATPFAPARDLSRERLERPVQVVTAEHLGWAAIAIYAVLTRLVALGARPLDAKEAGHALYAFERATPGTHRRGGLLSGVRGMDPSLTAGVFEFGGANDFSARIVFALSGLVLVAMAFVLRRHLGRAGGLALGAMLALSPSVTWFSRASATATTRGGDGAGDARRLHGTEGTPSRPRAAILGVAAGLMVAADPVGLATAGIFVAALALLGLWALVSRKNVGLAISVWLDRYAALPVIAIAAAGWHGRIVAVDASRRLGLSRLDQRRDDAVQVTALGARSSPRLTKGCASICRC